MKHIGINVELRRGNFTLKCDLDIPDKGVTAILGPSGSGKTMLMRLIAGLEKPEHGSISVNGHEWVNTSNRKHLATQKRKVGMVFQDYALFSHLTVAQNIAYGLPRKQRNIVTQYWVDRLHLQSLEGRYPHELSGGQKQRVALARALAPGPDILLLDEPFSAVDVALREKLRNDLKELVTHLEQPVMIVTHDLDEARYLADHIGVMLDGQIHRFADASSVFNEPGSYDVAKVLGWRNFLPVGSMTADSVSGSWGSLSVTREIPVSTDWLAIRPFHVRIANREANGLDAEVLRVNELGAIREMVCSLADGNILIMHSPWHDPLLAPGSRIKLQLPEQHIRCLQEGMPVKSVADYQGGQSAAAQATQTSASRGSIIPARTHS